MGFGLKKALGTLLSPLVAGGLLLLAALLLSFTERFGRLGRVMLAVGIPLGFLLGTTPVSDALLLPLERRYEAVEPERLDVSVEWIVVLGGGYLHDPALPAAAWLNAEGLYRLAEGIRLHRALPDTRLILSGAGRPALSTAEVFREAAVGLGVDPDRIVLLTGPRDTWEEAGHAALHIGPGEPFLLVTSGGHLPRAVRHFEARGLDPIPAPAQRYARAEGRWLGAFFLPSAENYRKVERAVHEYLGIAWARMTG